MKLIGLILIGACCSFPSVLGLVASNQTNQAGRVTTDNYGCVAPSNLGCFPYGSLVCVNPTNDPNNCGRCGAKCPAAGANTTAVAAKCTAEGCQCTAASKQCIIGTSTPGTCEIISIDNCNGGNTCTSCAAPNGTTSTGEYCKVDGTTGTCNTMAGCVPSTSTGTDSQPNLVTVPGTDSITPDVCNTVCKQLALTSAPTTFFTLAVDTNFDGIINTICSCYAGTSFALATNNTGTCNLGAGRLSYYGATSCSNSTDPSTCGTGSWQVYNSS